MEYTMKILANMYAWGKVTINCHVNQSVTFQLYMLNKIISLLILIILDKKHALAIWSWWQSALSHEV